MWVRVKIEPLLRRLHLARRRTVSSSMSGTLGLTGSLKGHKKIDNSGVEMLERVTLLEREVNELHRVTSDQRAEVEQRIGELQQSIENREAARESERARQLGRRLRAEQLGVLVFMIGVGLTTWGAIA